MTNSQRQTHEPADVPAITRGRVFRSGLLTAIQAAFVVAFVTLVPEYQRLFAGFGVPLPQFTTALIDGYAYVAVFIAACAAVQIGLFVRLMRSRTLVAWRRVRRVGLASISIALMIVMAVHVVPMVLLRSPV